MINRVILVGNVSTIWNESDHFEIETTHTWRDADGKTRQTLEYNSITAPNFREWLSIGQRVYVEGRLRPAGSSVEIVADTVKLLRVPA